jgi:hypothetical protein
MTNNTKTREAHDAYVANRREAGRVIDIETCEYMWLHADVCDPYCTFPRDDEAFQQYGGCVGRCWFVWSDESDGWIYVDDLPEEKWDALQRRMERERESRPTHNIETDDIPF